MRVAIITCALIIALGAGCSMKLTSTAFKDGDGIPTPYTCKGVDISPPLAWENAPAGTKTFALIVDDPDAPSKVWVHWVVWNIPSSSSSLREHIPTQDQLDDGTRQGTDDFGSVGWGGPCPPSGTHRYYFKLYALDAALSLSGVVDKEKLLDAMKGHVLAEAQLMGTYGVN
jgi:Raf kinase inhibitor-like YbhB/YbcL family protein